METDGHGGKCYRIGGADLASAPAASAVLPVVAPAGEPWAWEEWELTVEALRGTATLGAGKDGAVRLGMR